MPRVGVSTSEQVSGGSKFKFENGKGEITNAVVVVEFNEKYNETRTGFNVTIQPMNKDWQPTDDEPTTEFLSAGPVAKFHPGNAASSDDPEPDDLGDAPDTEGNCLISIEGKQIDKKSKMAKFAASLEEKGFKPAFLNGYAPNLIGLRAEFFQQPQEKGSNYTGKNDPTALVVNSIATFPANQGGKGGAGKTGAGTAAVKTAPKPAAAAAKVTPAATTTSDEVDSELSGAAVQALMELSKTSAGQTLTRQKVGAKLIVILAKLGISSKLHKPIQELVKNDDWFRETAGELGWSVAETGEASIPALAA